MSGVALVILLDKVAGCRHDIVVALRNLLFTPRYSWSIFRTNNRQCPLPSLICNQGIAVLKMFRRARLCVVHISDEILRFLAELVDLLRLLEVLILCSGGSRTTR